MWELNGLQTAKKKKREGVLSCVSLFVFHEVCCWIEEGTEAHKTECRPGRDHRARGHLIYGRAQVRGGDASVSPIFRKMSFS